MKLNILPFAAGIIAAACLGCTSNPLADQVKETNSRLPEEMDYGMTLERLSYADSTVSAYINVAESEVRLNTIRVHSESLKEDFAEYMRQQPDTTDVGETVSLIKENGATLKVLFCDEADTVAITVLPSEL